MRHAFYHVQHSPPIRHLFQLVFIAGLWQHADEQLDLDLAIRVTNLAGALNR
jgi:protein involved in temperature-dependent protein secretion